MKYRNEMIYLYRWNKLIVREEGGVIYENIDNGS